MRADYVRIRLLLNALFGLSRIPTGSALMSVTVGAGDSGEESGTILLWQNSGRQLQRVWCFLEGCR